MAKAIFPTSLEEARSIDDRVVGPIGYGEVAADPPAVADTILTYSKDVAGVSHLFARASDGTVYPLTPPATGGAVTAQYTALVDPALGNDATGTFGDLGLPYQTIQAAINAVPQGVTPATARTVYVILISSGTYDESLAINISRRRIVLLGLGPWNLGTFNAVDWAPSGVLRDITVTGADANIDGIRPALTIATVIPAGEGLTTHESYVTRPRISGKIDLTGVGAIGSVELTLMCEVFGNAGVSVVSGATIIQSYIYSSRMRGTLGGANWNLQTSRNTRFDALVTVTGYSLAENCRFAAGLTTTTAPAAGIEPSGLIDCNFAGVLTGPAGAARVNGRTYRYMKANGATLAGGATIDLLEDRPSERAVWVDGSEGSNTLGVRGWKSTPFATVQAALNAAQAGDTVYVGAGTYTEAIVMPATNNLSVRGSGRTNTIITNAAAVTLQWTPVAVGVTQFQMQDITIRNTGGFDAVNLNAAAVNDFFSSRAFLSDCEFVQTGVGNTFLATRINDIAFDSCRFQGGSAIFREPSAVGFNVCAILGGLDVRYDNAQPTPVNGRQNVTLNNASYVGDPNVGAPAGVTLRGNPLLVCNRDSGTFGGLVGVGLTFTVVPLTAPIILWGGFIGSDFILGTGVVTLPLPAIPAAPLAPAMVVDFSGAIFLGTGAVAFTIAGAIGKTISALQSRWSKAAPASVQIGTLLNLDARDSTFAAQAAFAVAGTGTMDRSRWLVLGTANPGGIFAIAFLPYPAAVYHASLTPAGVGGIIANVIAPAVAAVQVATSAPGGTLDLEIVRSP